MKGADASGAAGIYRAVPSTSHGKAKRIKLDELAALLDGQGYDYWAQAPYQSPSQRPHLPPPGVVSPPCSGSASSPPASSGAAYKVLAARSVHLGVGDDELSAEALPPAETNASITSQQKRDSHHRHARCCHYCCRCSSSSHSPRATTMAQAGFTSPLRPQQYPSHPTMSTTHGAADLLRQAMLQNRYVLHSRDPFRCQQQQ